MVYDSGVDPEKRKRCGTRFERSGSRQWRNHDRSGLSLPPRIDYRATAAPNHRVIPHPGLGVNWFPDATQQPERSEIMPIRILVAPANEGTNRRRGGIEQGYPILLD